MKRVAIALSGGVDSLVAAILLKRSGWSDPSISSRVQSGLIREGASLVGVFMRNWEDRDEGRGQRCTAEADFSRVRDICAALNIPCALADFVKDYWNDVFSHFVQAYEQGHTPNPDVLCNRHIKFSALHRYCRQHLDADVIATGHYAIVERDEAGKVRLKVATDSSKDQTYFLSQVPQASLARSVFPVGGLRKEEVREIASQAGFTDVARRKESMGLCFIGKRDFPQFISEYIAERPGRFVTLEGRHLGRHRGHHLFTVGQRARIGGQSQPLFVAGKDAAENTVTVVEGTHHPGLYVPSFTTSPPHWISDNPLVTGGTLPFRCRLRHRHQAPLVDVELVEDEEGLQVTCSNPLRAVAPGQYAVFYSGEECLGGACITATGPSLWQLELKSMSTNKKSRQTILLE